MAGARAGRARLRALARSAVGPPVGLALLTLAAFAPGLRNGFVWDDQFNFVDNPHVRGLGWSELRWMLTTAGSTHPGWGGQWIPLTWLTVALDYRLWGLNPLGYHLTNLVLHAANAVLLFALARRLLAAATPTGGAGALSVGAATTALFWALHPLRVESVAWATERRDVLSGVFFLLAVLTYVRAVLAGAPGRRWWLAGSVGAYALALASKATVLGLPLALLVLDAYPLARLRGRWRERLVEKVPYALLAAADAGLTLHAVRVAASLTPADQYPLPARVATALYGLWFYVEKTVFPLGLSPLYELPAPVRPLDPPFLVRALAVLVVSVGLWLVRRRWPGGRTSSASRAPADWRSSVRAAPPRPSCTSVSPSRPSRPTRRSGPIWASPCFGSGSPSRRSASSASPFVSTRPTPRPRRTSRRSSATTRAVAREGARGRRRALPPRVRGPGRDLAPPAAPGPVRGPGRALPGRFRAGDGGARRRATRPRRGPPRAAAGTARLRHLRPALRGARGGVRDHLLGRAGRQPDHERAPGHRGDRRPRARPGGAARPLHRPRARPPAARRPRPGRPRAAPGRPLRHRPPGRPLCADLRPVPAAPRLRARRLVVRPLPARRLGRVRRRPRDRRAAGAGVATRPGRDRERARGRGGGADPRTPVPLGARAGAGRPGGLRPRVGARVPGARLHLRVRLLLGQRDGAASPAPRRAPRRGPPGAEPRRGAPGLQSADERRGPAAAARGGRPAGARRRSLRAPAVARALGREAPRGDQAPPAAGAERVRGRAAAPALSGPPGPGATRGLAGPRPPGRARRASVRLPGGPRAV